MKNLLRLIALLVLAGMHANVEARTMNIEITSREVFADGATFGTADVYERLTGIMHGEVYPADPLNAVIVNQRNPAIRGE